MTPPTKIAFRHNHQIMFIVKLMKFQIFQNCTVKIISLPLNFQLVVIQIDFRIQNFQQNICKTFLSRRIKIDEDLILVGIFLFFVIQRNFKLS